MTRADIARRTREAYEHIDPEGSWYALSQTTRDTLVELMTAAIKIGLVPRPNCATCPFDVGHCVLLEAVTHER